MAKSSKNQKSVDVVEVVAINTGIYEVAKICEACRMLKDARLTLTDDKMRTALHKKVCGLENLARQITKKDFRDSTKVEREAQKKAKIAARDKKREEKKIEKKAKLEDQIAKLQAKMEKLQGK